MNQPKVFELSKLQARLPCRLLTPHFEKKLSKVENMSRMEENGGKRSCRWMKNRDRKVPESKAVIFFYSA